MTQFEKTFHFMKKPWVVVCYALLVVLAYQLVDKSLAIYLYQFNLRVNAHGLSILSMLGQWMVYVAVFFFAGLFFRFVKVNAINEARSWYLFSCVLLVNLVCLVLKIWLSRARPNLLFTSDEFGFYWFKFSTSYWSFPSGHTMTVVSVACAIGVLFPRYFFAALSLAFLVIVTRVLLTYHYLSDVLIAFDLSLLTIGFFTQYLKKNNWLNIKGLIVT